MDESVAVFAQFAEISEGGFRMRRIEPPEVSRGICANCADTAHDRMSFDMAPHSLVSVWPSVCPSGAESALKVLRGRGPLRSCDGRRPGRRGWRREDDRRRWGQLVGELLQYHDLLPDL